MSSNNRNLKEIIKAEAYNLGFCVIGFSAPDELDTRKYRQWIKNGYHAGMTYLASDTAIYTRQSPLHLFPECKTVISLGAAFPNPAQTMQQDIPHNSGVIAAYATGEDYHIILERKIEILFQVISKEYHQNIKWVSAIDIKPVLERDLAVKAGLGWIGKNGMLTNPDFGSALFLSEILLDHELPVDDPFSMDLCGSCTKCIEACPTHCILPDRTIDANQCLSYLTIEHRGIIQEDFFDSLHETIFGCDICLQVCPWNKKAKSKQIMEAFLPERDKLPFDISENLNKITDHFLRHFQKSAIRRAGKQGFLRNCMIRLSQNPTTENLKLIEIITSAMLDTYLPEQRNRIEIFHNKKGSS